MKVNISYSVELEEVLSSAYLLFKREKQKLKDKTENAIKILDKPFEEDTLIQTLQSIEDYRKASSQFNEKLNEINNILVGYAQIRYKETPPPMQSQGQNTEENEQI